MMRNRFSKFLCGAAVALLATAAYADEASSVPATLKAWKSAAYKERCFLQVDAPGEAGAAGLQREAGFATLFLPLRLTDGTAEAVALFGEDGSLLPVFVRPVTGGSETEIAFATYPGLRRYCLYFGSDAKPDQVSPLNLTPVPLQVRLRGVSAPPDFAPQKENGLTLERFKKMEEQTQSAPLAAVANLANPEPSAGMQPNIDDPECPFFGIKYTIFDRIDAIQNPQHYAALYEGFLRCPMDGDYKFAIDTPGAAHLVIDEVPIIKGEFPDEHRAPFALNGTAKLSAGVHRVVVHYAEVSANPELTNVDQRRFGLRLHWQPPFAHSFMCVPPLAFLKALPAVVTSAEKAPGTEHAFIHIEVLGHVQAAAQLGESRSAEWILLSARASGLAAGAHLDIDSKAVEGIAAPAVKASGAAGQKTFCAWVPAGRDALVSMSDNPAAARTLKWPTLKTGVKATMERELMDLEAELLVKSAPEFIYPNETGHIHAETVLAPKPTIIHKTRFDAREKAGWELLPPLPRPMGEFRLTYSGETSPAHEMPATPSESGRFKKRVSFNAAELESKASGETVAQSLELNVGGVPCQKEFFRILHAYAESYPGTLIAENGALHFRAKAAAAPLERVIMIVPHEDEASQRHSAIFKMLKGTPSADSGLFIGDPLLERSGPVALPSNKAPEGSLPDALAKATPNVTWTFCVTPGPHRYSPLMRMLADLEALRARGGKTKLPPLAVVNLGSADAAHQTPQHIFERALFTLVARLVAGGAEKIIVVGVIPEPYREKQSKPYQDRVATVVRQHKIYGINLVELWTTNDDTWTRRFSASGSATDEVLLATPNAGAVEEIVQQIQSRL